MPIDPTIPLGIKPYAGPNVQGTISTASGLLGLMANRQRLQANQILSDAYKQATDPQTGQTDFGRLQAIVSQSPAAAFLPDFMGKIAQQRNSQVQYEKSQLELALQQQSDIRNRIGSIRGLPGFGQQDLSQSIKDTITGAVQAGTLPVDQAVRELQSIPRNPTEQAAWVNQHFLNSLGGEAKIRALLPQTQTVNAGGTTQVLAVDPMTGQPVTTGVIQNTMTPGEATSPVQLTTPSGTPYATTRAQFAAGATGAPQMPGAASSYTGRISDAPGPATDVPAGGMQTGLSPAEQAALTSSGKGAGDALVSDQNAVNGSAARIYQLQQALAGLQGSTTGPGTDWTNKVKSFLLAQGPDALQRYGIVNADKIKSYDEANKYLTQYAMGQAGTMGEGTDKKLATTLSGNASTSISNLAAQDVVKASIGLERMRQAQVGAFDASGQSPSQYHKFAVAWNKEQDPRVFIWGELSVAQKRRMRDTMTPAQQKTFALKYNAALQNGWITPAEQ